MTGTIRRDMLISGVAAALCVCGSGGPALSQGVGVAGDGNLEAVLESIRTDHGLPALAVALVYDGAVVEQGASGVRGVGFDERVTDADQWHLGSLTKAITATLAAVLVEEGVVTWDTTIGEVFPLLVGSIREEYVDVRLEELLYHLAGLPVDITRAPSWGRLRADTAAITEQRRRFAAELLAIAPDGPRGQYLYSNAGYIVAGAMLERISGQSWEELVVGKVFDPLDMRSCGFGAPSGPGRDQPWGHVGHSGDWQPVPPGPFADNPAAIGPASTVHCSVGDYAKFMIEHLAGADGQDGLVSAASYARLHTPAPGSPYAMGWGVGEREWAGGRVLNHHGSNTMWWASVWLAPERHLGVFAATNAGGDDAFAGTDAAVAVLIARFAAAGG